ncbi:MAG: alginate export family protein [Methylococcales bacterium]|nr:alginate export family protein [Methylococcales bacterium]
MQKNTCFGFLGSILLGLSSGSSYAQDKPWRLDQYMGVPDWLSLSFEHRTRYETLDQQYRAIVNGNPGNGGDQALVFRTLIHAKADLKYFRIGAEMMDSRIKLADSGSASSSTRLTPAIANPIDLLQAYIEVPLDNVWEEASHSVLRAGRITMDVGSRRLVARNRFRNTINAFTGLDWQWTSADKTFRAFYTLPVHRKVDGDVLDNKPSFDVEETDIRFWGIHYSQALFSKDDKGEVFLFGLNEEDTENRATKDRELYTFGMRLWNSPAIEQFDYQLETVYQLGESKASRVSAMTLDHWAHFHHAELGYSFNAPWLPRLIMQYDYASGDDDPNDGQNNRFDTLYGARRFDFGPTSIYGAFARNNLHSPALRLNLKPIKSLKPMVALRGFWRASTADKWTTAGISGSQAYIGTQIEARLRWEPLPKNLQIEAGVAHLFAGDLMDQAGKQDATYAYTQITVKF